MKHAILFVSLGALLLSACKYDPEPIEPRYLKNYIIQYCDAPLHLETSYEYGSVKTVRGSFSGEPYYFEGDAEFERIAARNGDTTYNRTKFFPGYHNQCCADNFRSVSIVCTDAAWDEEHPAGSSLNDLVEMSYEECGSYVQSGYKVGNEWNPIRKLISELSEEDLFMINSSFHLYFVTEPAKGTYELKMTMVTTDGEERTATKKVYFNTPE